MNFITRATIATLALGLTSLQARAAEDDLDFDDDFFEEVSRDKADKADRRRDDEGDAPAGDPLEAGLGEDPEWDVPAEAGFDEDPPEPGMGAGFAEDPPEPGMGAGFSEDPPDDLAVARPPKPAPAPAPKAAPKKPAGPQKLTLSTAGQEVLGGGYEAAVVAIDVDAVVVELPVLVARSGGDFGGSDYWLVTEFAVSGKKVGESRSLVTKAAIADLGPTVVWVKQHVPVLENAGTVDVKVSRVEGEDPPEVLFSKKAPYKL